MSIRTSPVFSSWVVTERKTLSLMTGAGAVAQILREAGVEHLAMLDESSLALPLGLFGSAHAGLPFVPLNYRLTGAELESLLAQISPALLVTGAERVEEVGRLPGIQAVSRDDFIARARALRRMR